jgi:hypothetical protein
MERRVRLGLVGEIILGLLVVVGAVAVGSFVPNVLKVLKPYLKDKKYSGKQYVTRNIDSLIRSGLVMRVVASNGEVQLTLTKSGLWEATLRRNFTASKKQKWDRKWRVVIFDIPNTKGRLRKELTRGMRMYGFHLLQKSVWVYPYPCDEFVDLLRVHLEVRENVLYMTVSELEGDTDLRREFGLKK